MNLVLYISIVLIWGSTWIAIYFQLGDVPILVSIFYRFALSVLILMPFMVLTKTLQKTTLVDQCFIAMQGLCLFSLNFICFYHATSYISSGLVSIIFSFAVVYNAINNQIFYNERITNIVIFASILGILGLSLIFYPEVESVNFSIKTLIGIGLSFLGTLFFSFANMISKRNSNHGLKPQTTIAYGMIYGTVLLAILIFLSGTPLVMPQGAVYISSLFFLSTIGTIIAFIIYLSLVARVGPTQAAYATVLFPVVALAFSTVFEDYQWTMISMVGLIFVMLGNIVINLYSAPKKI